MRVNRLKKGLSSRGGACFGISEMKKKKISDKNN